MKGTPPSTAGREAMATMLAAATLRHDVAEHSAT